MQPVENAGRENSPNSSPNNDTFQVSINNIVTPTFSEVDFLANSNKTNSIDSYRSLCTVYQTKQHQYHGAKHIITNFEMPLTTAADSC